MSYSQYIERYAEPEARALAAWLSRFPDTLPKQRALAAIPLCRESQLLDGLLASLQSAAAHHPATVIFTVNQRASAPMAVRDDNERTLVKLTTMLAGKVEQIADHVFAGPLSPDLHAIVVDRCRPGRGLPERQGVGMARKIGCDLACVMAHQPGLAIDRFIRNTDGDVRVAHDFFRPITESGLAAALYPFRHQAKNDGIDAVLSYEVYLHYYVRGLRFAGSDYAFHTVGSTIACEISSYVSCRGFPKKEAGEDFYLLNKLAKVGSVREIERTPLTLVARDSDRVPFGTGASQKKIEGLLQSGGEYKVYHPDCFRLLKLWLTLAHDALADADASAIWSRFVSEATRGFSEVSAAGLDHLQDSLQLVAGMTSVLAKSPVRSKRDGHLRIWFDGFRTMRFLNLARDLFFGVVPVSEAAKEF